MANCRPKDTKCTKETMGHGRAGFDENFAFGRFRRELGTGSSPWSFGHVGVAEGPRPGSVLDGLRKMRVTEVNHTSPPHIFTPHPHATPTAGNPSGATANPTTSPRVSGGFSSPTSPSCSTHDLQELLRCSPKGPTVLGT